MTTRVSVLAALAALALLSAPSLATVILTTGTKDGLLLCEDTRLTLTDSQTNQQQIQDGRHKAEAVGQYGLFALAGDLTFGPSSSSQPLSLSTLFSPPLYGRYDIAAEVRSFFQSHDIRSFVDLDAWSLESSISQALQKKAFATLSFQGPKLVVLLFWIDHSDQIRGYLAPFENAWPMAAYMPLIATPGSSLAPPHKGTFLSYRTEGNSEPNVIGDGRLAYDEIRSGSDAHFDDVRNDSQLRPLLKDFVPAASVDSYTMTRAVKVLIQRISERQQYVPPGNLGVGPECDCFLVATGGVVDMNNALLEEDKKAAAQEEELKRAAAKKPRRKPKK